MYMQLIYPGNNKFVEVPENAYMYMYNCAGTDDELLIFLLASS